jgi:hypothetical protein
LMEERKTDGASVWAVKREIEDLGNVSLDFDLDRAGCQLAWDLFFNPSRQSIASILDPSSSTI